MTALAADIVRIRFGTLQPGSPNQLGVKAATLIRQGALVVNDAGVAAPGRTATGLFTLGVAKRQYDNSGGAASAITGEYEEGDFLFTNDGGDAVTAAAIGNLCYITDDNTVSITATGKSIAGRVKAINPPGYTGVVVDVTKRS